MQVIQNGYKEINGDAARINMFIESNFGPCQNMVIINTAHETIEGQYKGNYYYEKININGRNDFALSHDLFAIKYWLTDHEIHIDVIEIDPKSRGCGIGTKIINLFKTVAMMTGRKLTLRAEPIDLFESMGKQGAVKYGPKFYMKYRTAIDRRMDRLIKFYKKNEFVIVKGTGVCFEYKYAHTPESLQAIELLKKMSK